MKILTKEFILNYLKQHKNEICKKYNINKIGIFGSFANDKHTKDSDIDIVYETPSKDLTFSQVFQLEDELKKYFTRDIDLVNLKYMNPLIKRKAMKDIIYV